MYTNLRASIRFCMLAGCALLVLVGCDNQNQKYPKKHGEVTVQGTFCEVPNTCPKGETCLPGVEVALSADKTYYLSHLNVKCERPSEDTCYFVLDGTMNLSATDSVEVKGDLLEYLNNQDNTYFRIDVEGCRVLSNK